MIKYFLMHNKYLIQARLILTLHICIMLAFWAGALFSFSHPKYVPLQILFVTSIIVLRQAMKGECILTKIERDLLVKAGRTPYGPSCYNHYLFNGVFKVNLTSHQSLWFIIVFKVIPGLSPILLYLQ